MMRTLLALVLAIGFATPAFAQSNDAARSTPATLTQSAAPDAFRIGTFAGYASNYHYTSTNIFCCPECGTFSDGAGSGMALALFGELPLQSMLKEWLGEGSLQIEAIGAIGLSERGGAFGEAVTAELPVQDPATKQYVPLERKHSYDATMRYMTYDLGLKVIPYPEIPVYLSAMVNFSTAVGDAARYVQSEEILAPNGVLYPETNTVDREVGRGAISNLRSPFGVIGSLGYPVPLGDHLTAAPEVRYYYPLSSVTTTNNWRISSLQAGISIRYSIEGEPVEAPVPPVRNEPLIVRSEPAPPAPIPPLVVPASARSIDVVETIVTETFPILPYVFFDSASANLPERYARLEEPEKRSFRENALSRMISSDNKKSLEAYYHLLNIIGSRMVKNPAATLTISGTTDGREVEKPRQSALARDRAETIKAYLVDAWGIAPSRLTLATLSTPAHPSTDAVQEGLQENRRVELSSSSDVVLGPIVYERFREHVIEPSAVPLAVQNKGQEITGWRMTINARDTVVFDERGSLAPIAPIEWKLDQRAARILASRLGENDSVTGVFTSTNSLSQITSSRFSLPASSRLNPYELSRLSLIVFDFDDASIHQANRRKIQEFTRRSIYPSSSVRITGSTDDIGERDHNQELSEARAKSVNTVILSEKSDANVISVQGVGSNKMLFTNELPEGRYYCRTVMIEVETPLETLGEVE